ncbi:helix-turn-helix domain-containing protein [Oceanobacillus kapialis]|uniref:Helix-turn-helix domain-containing protein n=1 Tax=Oceanobacillus kapialis TaxID=481353 RepID=A0ABW5PZJ7_9BACI
MELTKSLKFMRKRSGLSQEKLSEKMHMSRANLSKIERGLVPIRAQELFKWAKETNSQDVIVAIACNIDIATATQLVTESLKLVGMIFIGGIS